MKYIHIPTFLLHLSLLVLASMTINHYPDFFLSAGLLAIILHLIWAVKSKGILGLSHLAGCVIQFLVFHLNLIDVNSGAFGLGGGEFALLFYYAILAFSIIAEAAVLCYKLVMNR